jgi:hypothetical protein
MVTLRPSLTCVVSADWLLRPLLRPRIRLSRLRIMSSSVWGLRAYAPAGGGATSRRGRGAAGPAARLLIVSPS